MNGIGQAVDYLEAGLRQFPEGALRPVLIALLGFIFLWSGIAKARSPWSTAYAIVDFGAVRRPHGFLTWAVIIGELGLATLLLIAPALSSGLVLLSTGIAAVTLLLFVALIARALRTSPGFKCACFGSEGEEISRATMARSASLATVAIGCAAAGSLGPLLALDDLALTWCAGAGIVGIGVLATRTRRLALLPQPCGEGSV
jgi:hypothetical protein